MKAGKTRDPDVVYEPEGWLAVSIFWAFWAVLIGAIVLAFATGGLVLDP